MSDQAPSGDGKSISGGLVATVGGLGVLGVFVAQNRESVTFHFLMWDFSWPLWLYTIVVAVFGAIIWLGLGSCAGTVAAATAVRHAAAERGSPEFVPDQRRLPSS